MRARRLRAMFNRGTEAIGRVLGVDPLANQGFADHYVCPICVRLLPRSALELHDGRRDLTLEDVPPRSFPGSSSVLALTCRWCNHTAGSRWESDLKTHGRFLKSKRGSGSVRGTIVSEDLTLNATLDLDERKFTVKRWKTEPTAFDTFVSRSGVGRGRGFQFRSTLRYDSTDASLALVKAGYVLAFARFGYSWALHQAVAPIRHLLADGLGPSPTGLSPAAETILHQPGADLKTRRLVWLTKPIPALVAVFGENAVVLPYPGSPPDLGEAIAALESTKSGHFVLEHGFELPWPKRMELSVDFDEELS